MRTGGCPSLRSLCALWLLLCLATRGWGQRSAGQESEGSVTGARLEEKDALCHGRGCYAVFLQRRTFREAGRSCRERGGTLATAHDQEAADAVHRLLAGLEPQGSRVRLRLWIGLHRAPRQCSTTRPLRGFVWVTGDQEGHFTNWLREDTPGTCAAPRCVAMTVHTSESARESVDNFKWLDGSCGLALDGFVCQYAYRGMCHPLEDEGQGPAVYSTPFHLISRMLTHVPYGSVAAVPCPPSLTDPDAPAEQTVLCMERDDGSVGWSRDAPLCGADIAPPAQDWCSGDHGCEQHCQNTDSDYYCYCSEGYTLAEDGYSCETDPLDPTDRPELSLDSAGPSEPPRLKVACMAMGCEHDCVETSRGVRCTCPPGYQIGPDGRRCSDVDECRQGPCTQACVNAPGTFHCACHAGYQPDEEGECVDVDECEHEGHCEGTCENTEGSFKCTCHHGYQMSGSRMCEDVDECVGASPCQQQCLNYVGGYQCFCDDGYELQADGLTCLPTSDDEEYSTLTPDPTDSTHVLDLDNDGLRTTKPKFDSNFDVEWLTDAPKESNNHLNQWDVPRRYQTEPSPTREESNSNEVHPESGGQEGDRQAPTGAEGAGASEGKRKHDKSWLLVALLVPLCVFLVVMLALGIVYCTSCAVDKSLRLSDCCRWILPTSPPDHIQPKARA
uniref:endosialin-like n=1 Tax=Doryrhamphus excisus TaxID=161450 RepID=UPI0025ADA785|nr:endosialin-like [Doryrhamphus excisus]